MKKNPETHISSWRKAEKGSALLLMDAAERMRTENLLSGPGRRFPTGGNNSEKCRLVWERE